MSNSCHSKNGCSVCGHSKKKCKCVLSECILIEEFKGDDGCRGHRGHKGCKGATGPQGVTGPCCKGPTGADGRNGATGANGKDGATGADGRNGDTGADGRNGDTGADGRNGDTGPRGETGPCCKGDTGADGKNGDTGPRGGTGPVGATGPRPGAGSGLFVFSSGLKSISSGGNFVGQGLVSNTSRVETDFPLTIKSDVDAALTPALIVNAAGTVTNFSAIGKGITDTTILHIYAAAVNEGQTEARLLGPTGANFIRILGKNATESGATGPILCGDMILNSPISECETLVIFEQILAGGSIVGVSATLSFAV